MIILLPPQPGPITRSGSRAGGPTTHVSGYTMESDSQRSLEDWGRRDQLGDCDRQGQGPQLHPGSAGDLGATGHKTGLFLCGRPINSAARRSWRAWGDSPSLKPEALTEPSPPSRGPCKALKSSSPLLEGSGQSDPRCDVGEQFIQTGK